MVNDWGFYWAHRALHSKFLYGKIHKMHHSYKGTIGFAAEYAHPLEDLLSGIIPTTIVCALGGAHFLVWFVWITVRLSEAYETHSGYCFHGTWLH